MDKHPQILGINFRYSFGGGGGSTQKAPKQRPPIATIAQISGIAQRAGQEERKRLTTRKGKRGTIFAGRRDLAPARTRGAALRPVI